MNLLYGCLSTRSEAALFDEQYTYSATQNNGKMISKKNWVSGEDVQYAYDSLNRLMSAVTVGPEWGNSYVYDGFGNLTDMNIVKGSAPNLHIIVSASTNRVNGQAFWPRDSWRRQLQSQGPVDQRAAWHVSIQHPWPAHTADLGTVGRDRLRRTVHLLRRRGEPFQEFPNEQPLPGSRSDS